MTFAADLSDYGPRLIRALDAIPISAVTSVDVRADVRRGRRARRMRRVRRTIVNVAALSAVGAIASLVTPARPNAPSPNRPVALVAYHGAQPSGLTVDAAPSSQPVHVDTYTICWGSGPTTLVATLLPTNATTPGSLGRPVDVGNGRIGWIVTPTETAGPPAVLRVLVAVPGGRLIEIVASHGLHWNDAQVALFASHVMLRPMPAGPIPTPARSDQPLIAVTPAAGG